MVATEIKKGMYIKYDGQLYNVLDMQHHKPGKGGAMMRTKIKNLVTGTIIERSFKGGDKIEQITIDRRKYQYLYQDGSGYCFMDSESYEQIYLQKEQIGKPADFLKEGLDVNVVFYGDQVLGIDFPKNVVLKVTYSEPGHRGDTATNVQKTATVESGLEVQVPLFINTGDSIVVDVETGKYVSRK